ncbi:unnamed protein product [Caenorhabditis bovis]|uniref:Uncharacterized protein n=1 Tax=Caenorhabditis bovis TaxID=2654633 RepID=A0A8S1EHV5_9PELO|nr:unnamed protein product [Caenorhabditis bovis]
MPITYFCRILLTIRYVSPGCQSQCVNCIPPSYQYVVNLPPNYGPSQATVFSTNNRSPCCPPTSNVQTIQTARAFTNNAGAQASQVVMYYNGQRIIANGQQNNNAMVSDYPQGSTNYQNPGTLPPRVNNNYAPFSTAPPNNFNGGVMQQPQGPIIGGNVNGQQPQGIDVGGNVNQNGGIDVGGNVNQQGGQDIGSGAAPYSTTGYNVGQGINPTTLAPAQEVGYQPFVPAGNVQYNNNQPGTTI